MSDMVENLEDRFSRVAAHLIESTSHSQWKHFDEFSSKFVIKINLICNEFVFDCLLCVFYYLTKIITIRISKSEPVH